MDFTILQILSLLDPAYNLQQRFMTHHHFITNIPQNSLRQWKKNQNRSIFGEDMDKCLRLIFLVYR